MQATARTCMPHGAPAQNIPKPLLAKTADIPSEDLATPRRGAKSLQQNPKPQAGGCKRADWLNKATSKPLILRKAAPKNHGAKEANDPQKILKHHPRGSQPPDQGSSSRTSALRPARSLRKNGAGDRRLGFGATFMHHDPFRRK